VRLVFGLPLVAGTRHSIQVFDPEGVRRDTGPVVIEPDRVGDALPGTSRVLRPTSTV
jgi:acetamidase/formamidase